MLDFVPRFLGQAFMTETGLQQAKNTLQLLVDSIDSSISALPEGSTKRDLSERSTGCKNLLSSAPDMAFLSRAKTCLELLREDVARVPAPGSPTSSTSVIQAGFLGIPTWLLVLGAVGIAAVGIGSMVSKDSVKVKLLRVDPRKTKPVKVAARKDGTCRKGSRHMRDHTGCWSAKALD